MATLLRPHDPALVADLGRLLAPERVLFRPIDRLGRSPDASLYRLIPQAGGRPRGPSRVRRPPPLPRPPPPPPASPPPGPRAPGHPRSAAPSSRLPPPW